jgi:glutathione S-transferase
MLFNQFCELIRVGTDVAHLTILSTWRFTDKDVIAFSGQGLVPVLVDSGKTVAGSWAIASVRASERYCWRVRLAIERKGLSGRSGVLSV